MNDSKFGEFPEKSGGDKGALELIVSVDGIFMSVTELKGERNVSNSGSPLQDPTTRQKEVDRLIAGARHHKLDGIIVI